MQYGHKRTSQLVEVVAHAQTPMISVMRAGCLYAIGVDILKKKRHEITLVRMCAGVLYLH